MKSLFLLVLIASLTGCAGLDKQPPAGWKMESWTSVIHRSDMAEGTDFDRAGNRTYCGGP